MNNNNCVAGDTNVNDATQKCHYRPHLKGAALSVYEFSIAVTNPDRVFNASNETLTRKTGYGRDAVIAARTALVESGWWLALGGNLDKAKSGGKFRPNQYRVIEFPEWHTRHPEKCGVWKNPTRDFPDAGNSDASVYGKPDISDAGKTIRNVVRSKNVKGERSCAAPARPAAEIRSLDDLDAKTQHLIRELEKRLGHYGLEMGVWLRTSNHLSDCVCGLAPEKDFLKCGCDPWAAIGLKGPVGSEEFQRHWIFDFGLQHQHEYLRYVCEDQLETFDYPPGMVPEEFRRAAEGINPKYRHNACCSDEEQLKQVMDDEEWLRDL